jgi:chemotaxis response regulator CheB
LSVVRFHRPAQSPSPRLAGRAAESFVSGGEKNQLRAPVRGAAVCVRAKIYRQHAIAVVLTGGDGDGSFGVQIIKDKGGTVIAQDRPTSQDFSMPQTSIETGDVDFILPLNEIAAKLIELVGAIRLPSPGRTAAGEGLKRRAPAKNLTPRYPHAAKPAMLPHKP